MAQWINEGIVLNGQAQLNGGAIAVGAGASIVGQAGGARQLSALLDDLRAAIARIPAGESRKRLERACDGVRAEVESKQPDRGLATLSAKGLVEAAKAVKDIAPDILATALAVARFFVGA
jgi:hypothetical protein